MAIVYSELIPGTPLTVDEMEQISKAEKIPVVYDEDCPELTPEMEMAFVEARRKRPYCGPVPLDLLEEDQAQEVVTVSISKEAFEKAKSLSSDYLAVLGQLLNQAIMNYSETKQPAFMDR